MFPSLSHSFAVLADNLKSNPGIKWQYFSSEEGIFTVFPAHKFQCKGSYEHRSRYKATFPFFSFVFCCCCNSVVLMGKRHNNQAQSYHHTYNLSTAITHITEYHTRIGWLRLKPQQLVPVLIFLTHCHPLSSSSPSFLTPPPGCQLLWGGPEGMLMACCPHTP